jgi:hypothetical protein
MRCHECGDYRHNLANHIKLHFISATEYKAKHGLKKKTALVPDSLRVRLSSASRRREGMLDPEQAAERMAKLNARRGTTRGTTLPGKAENRNAAGTCREQTLQKVSALAKDLGRTPTVTELAAAGVAQSDLIYHFGSVTQAMKLAGLLPNASGGQVRLPSEEFLIQQLRVFYYNNRRLPRTTDMNRGFFAFSAWPYYRLFGSFRNAIEVAFSPKEINRDGHWTRFIERPQHPRQYEEERV